MKPTVALNRYFNSDPDTKLSAGQFAAEVKRLSPDEKLELARLACVEMGVELEEPQVA